LSGQTDKQLLQSLFLRKKKHYSQVLGFYDDVEAMARTVIAKDQKRFVISVAAEMKGSVIQALTNHGLKDPIHLKEEMERRLPGRTFELIGDAVSSTWAESGPAGALHDLTENSLFGSMIYGTGVGFNLFRKVNGIPVPVPGVYAFGHFNISPSHLSLLGMAGLLDGKDFTCGCTMEKPAHLKHADICFESIVRGSELQDLFGRFIRSLAVGSAFHPLPNSDEQWRTSLTGWQMKKDEIISNPLFRQIFARENKPVGDNPEDILAFAAEHIDNCDVTAALQETKGNEWISKLILSKVGALFAIRMQQVESQWTPSQQQPINVALVGSIGHYMGPFLTDHIRNYAEGYLYAQGRKPVWVKPEFITKFATGKIHPDEIDARGCLEYHLHLERSSHLQP